MSTQNIDFGLNRYNASAGFSVSSHIFRRNGNWHGGIDLAAARGTDIPSAANGTVVYSSDGGGRCGRSRLSGQGVARPRLDPGGRPARDDPAGDAGIGRDPHGRPARAGISALPRRPGHARSREGTMKSSLLGFSEVDKINANDKFIGVCVGKFMACISYYYNNTCFNAKI